MDNAGAVVRVGDTVRRPVKKTAVAVRALLLHLEGVGFDGAPRYLGSDEQGREESFVVGPFRRHRLLNGLDEIGMTLQHPESISRFEQKHVHYVTRPQSFGT